MADQRNIGPLLETDYSLIRWHGFASIITVLISALFGILFAGGGSIETLPG